MMSDEGVTITIPKRIYESLQRRIIGKDFDSVNSYVQFILEQIAVEDLSNKDRLSKDDEEKVKENLRSLGYI